MFRLNEEQLLGITQNGFNAICLILGMTLLFTAVEYASRGCHTTGFPMFVVGGFLIALPFNTIVSRWSK